MLLYRGAWQEYELHEIEIAVPLSPSDILQKRNAIFMHESQKDEALFPGSDPREFWRAGPGIEALDGEADPASGGEAESALQKLGAAPFPKGKFPFLGFLATVYDHVATHARNRDRHGEPE